MKNVCKYVALGFGAVCLSSAVHAGEINSNAGYSNTHTSGTIQSITILEGTTTTNSHENGYNSAQKHENIWSKTVDPHTGTELIVDGTLSSESYSENGSDSVNVEDIWFREQKDLHTVTKKYEAFTGNKY